MSYGLTEVFHAYGFLSVFVTALAFRTSPISGPRPSTKSMHDLIEQIERISMMVLLLLFGGAIVNGLLSPLVPMDIAAALVILLVIRPITALVGMTGISAPWHEKTTIAFFGIRGIGSFYYLAMA